jgi:hypothetical protein
MLGALRAARPGGLAVTAACLALASCAVTACEAAAPAAPRTQQAAAPAATPRTPAAGADARACAIAPPAVVSRALKLPLGPVVGTVEGPVTVCAYTGHYEVIVRFQRGESGGEFAASRHSNGPAHQLIAAVAGLGSGAYLDTYTLAKPPVNTLAARRGRLAVFITAPAALGAERKLMVRLLSRE